ncbi:MAG: hypothetical protein AB7G39_02190 [Alphaproteobacteria bacterium]
MTRIVADTVSALLRQAGIAAAPLEQHALAPGKTLVRLAEGGGFVKLGHHPAGRALLRAEARAYAEPPPDPPYRRPELLGFHDGGDATLLWLSPLPGHALSPWAALRRRTGPYAGQATDQRRLADLLPEPETPWIAGWNSRLAGRWGSVPVRTGPSHGDFVYWNLLRPTAGGAYGLLDYEYFEPRAPAMSDCLFWQLAPICRQAIRRRIGALVYPVVARLAPAPELALTLLRHGARFEREERQPDIDLLYTPDTLHLRRGQVALYAALLDRLLA